MVPFLLHDNWGHPICVWCLGGLLRPLEGERKKTTLKVHSSPPEKLAFQGLCKCYLYNFRSVCGFDFLKLE